MQHTDNHLMQVLKRILKSHPWMCAMTLIAIAGAVITSLYPPLVLESIVDDLSNTRSVAFGAAMLYFILIAVSGFLEAGQNAMITKLGQKITHGLRSELDAKLERMPASYLTAHPSGEIASRFVNDVDTVDTLFTDGIVSMFADACKVISILIVIFTKSLGLGILMIIVTPLLFLMTRAFQKRMLKAQMDNRKAIARVNNHIPETIRNIRMIRSFHVQKHMEDRYDDYIDDSYQATDRSNFFDAIYSPIVNVVSAGVIAVMMIFAASGGTFQNLFGLSVGTAVAIIAYVNKVFDPLESIGMEIQSIQSAVAGVKRINEFLDEPERTVPETMPEEDDRKPCISFDNVTFGYNPNRIILHGLSFAIKDGEAVTFIGRTGAGKSTIFRLLLGLYLPQNGTAEIHGMNAAEIPDSAKRKLFGYVEQSFHPVTGTILDQITLFDPDISREDAIKAAKLVYLDDALEHLPKGFDTPFEQASFSEGQLQLLSIARAIAAKPKILLLDEITANLDSATETCVLLALNKASKGRTVISISHRLNEAVKETRTIEIPSLQA